MNRRRFILIVVELIAIVIVEGRNDFNPAFPTTFSFNATTPFFWLDSRDSDLLSIFVIGDTDQFERLELPLDPQACLRRTVVDTITTCTSWENNGTATFGGNYAATLEAGRLYHMVINYEVQDDGSKGSSESEVFRMINPLPLPTGTGSPIRTSSVTQSQTSSATQAPSSTSSTSQNTSPGSRSTTSTSISASASTANPTTPTTASPSPSPTSSSAPQNGLTPGAKVGITVGVLVLVIIIFFAAFFFHRRRQAKKKVKCDQHRDQQANRSTAVNLEDIDITLGSPVTYDRVYEGRQGWHQRSLPPIFVPGATTDRVQSQRELHGSPF